MRAVIRSERRGAGGGGVWVSFVPFAGAARRWVRSHVLCVGAPRGRRRRALQVSGAACASGFAGRAARGQLAREFAQFVAVGAEARSGRARRRAGCRNAPSDWPGLTGGGFGIWRR